MSRIDNLLVQAISRNQMDDFLEGVGEYSLSKSAFIPSIVPTDVSEVWKALFRYYKKDNKIKNILEATLIELIYKNEYSLYIVTLYIFQYCLMKERNYVTFFISLESILTVLNKELIKKRKEMEGSIEFPEGTSYANAWEDIMRWNKVLKERFNLFFIKIDAL